jgi:serine/threonine-protein kinase
MNPVLPKPGDVIADKYELLEKLGSGAFGAVFKAKQLGIDRTVAVKILMADADQADSAAVSRFRREATLSASLDHPNTITVFDYGQDASGMLYLVMEYIRGESLKERLFRETKIEPELAIRIAQQVLLSLQEAHGRGIVHRDLKPANIMLLNRLGEDNVVKIVDFGIAKFMNNDPDAGANGVEARDDLTLEGRIVGTPRYMAPEQIGGRAVWPSTDLYALGLILFEMITGRAAVTGDSTFTLMAQQLSDEHAIDVNAPGLDPQWAAILRRATSKAVDGRFQDAGSFLEGLKQLGVCSERPADEAPGAAPEPTDAPPRSAAPLVVLAVVGVLLALAVVVFVVASPWGRQPDPPADAPGAGVAGALGEPSPTDEPPARPPLAERRPEIGDEADDLPSMREVALNTEPPQALVMREGEVVGRTPLTVALEEGATPSFQLSLEGYLTATVEIGAGDPAKIVLQPDVVSAAKERRPKRRVKTVEPPTKPTYTAF